MRVFRITRETVIFFMLNKNQKYRLCNLPFA
jgi:hypothetical protein